MFPRSILAAIFLLSTSATIDAQQPYDRRERVVSAFPEILPFPVGNGVVVGGHDCDNPLVNNGFEDGSLTGWTTSYKQLDDSSWASNPLLGQLGAGPVDAAWQGFPTNSGYLVDTDGLAPYVGQYTACLNDPGGGKHMTRLEQEFCLDPFECEAIIWFHWGALLGSPANHTAAEQPYFSFNVTQGSTELASFTKNGGDVSIFSGWFPRGSYGDGSLIYYRSSVEQIVLTQHSTEPVKITIEVADCAKGAHGAAAFLDQVFVTHQGAAGPIDWAVPDLFTPNGDGINDTFRIEVDNAVDVHMEVFDRWGDELLHSSDQFSLHGFDDADLLIWDGKVDGVVQEVGEYLYRGTLSNCDMKVDIPLTPFFLVN